MHGFQRAVVALDQVRELAPEAARQVTELWLQSEEGLADAHALLNDPALAMGGYERVLEVLLQLDVQARDPAAHSLTIIGLEEKLADLAERHGRLNRALELLQDGRDRLLSLGADETDQSMSRLAGIERSLGYCLAAQGDTAALRCFESALTRSDQSLSKKPEDTDLRLQCAASRIVLGWMLGELGLTEPALQQLNDAVVNLSDLAEAHAEHFEVQRLLAVAHHHAAVQIEASGDSDRAMAGHERALGLLLSLAERDPSRADVQVFVCMAASCLGQLLHRKNEPLQATGRLPTRAVGGRVWAAAVSNLHGGPAYPLRRAGRPGRRVRRLSRRRPPVPQRSPPRPLHRNRARTGRLAGRTGAHPASARRACKAPPACRKPGSRWQPWKL